MSFNQTIDDVVYAKNTQPDNIAEKYFVEKQWSNPLYDTNTSSNYSSNQIIFNTESLSNSDRAVNYQEGLIILPLVVRVYRSDNPDWTTAGSGLETSDFMLGFKNSHVQLVQSVQVTYNNVDIVQNVPLTNLYLSFIEHTEFGIDDEILNGPLTGYAKDSSESWYYATPAGAADILTGDSRGVGIGNNCNAGDFSLTRNETMNEGFLRRQKFMNRYKDGKNSVLGDMTDNRNIAKNYIENTATGKYIYYDCVLRLRDLVPNLFSNLPMGLGMKLKITLTLNNNIDFEFSKNNVGNFVIDTTKFSNVSSATNPLMLAASYNVVDITNGTAGLNSIAPATAILSCGSASLPWGTAAQGGVAEVVYTYKVSMRLGKNNDNAHVRPQCILYVPSYKFNPKYEIDDYFSKTQRIRKVHYTELEYQNFTVNQNNNVNIELSSSCLRPKRLIIIPIIAKTSTYKLNPLSSPFATEGATTSPCNITNFNCSVSNVNLYPNDINYDYDCFLQQLNGQTGFNANQISGLVSSRINLTDFQNNYHYIVCDLSRRTTAQDMIPVSIRCKFTLKSPLTMDFHAFIEREKIIEIDTMTGALINRY
jgi:hypothetical protein